ncbi:hypothetical protein HDF16_004183 [Granulicella aggregans]|uniref:Choice-of-anchor A domain-containing protein n=2 Tax=Granulicella aggregans TaxID=474949 RepID=A0A7W7ZGK3_9BACT|nr:hypothetical protein [Granulicella aggregans]
MVKRPPLAVLTVLAGLYFALGSTGPAAAQVAPDTQRTIPPAENLPALGLNAAALRGGDRYSNCINTPVNEAACHLDTVVFDQPAGANGKTSQAAHRIDVSAFGPGLSLGNMGGWRVNKVDVEFLNVANRGISQAHSLFLYKHAAGDTMGSYNYVYSDGGSTALSDESIKGDALDMGETTGYFHGSIAATAGTGDTVPALKFVSGNDWTTDGAPLLDITQGKISGRIMGAGSSVAGITLGVMKVDNELPLSTAWGVCENEIPNNNLVQKIAPFTCNVRLRAGSFTAGGTVCVSGPNYPEQARITAASVASGDHQKITIEVRNPNSAGANIFQGGVCGQYISFDANLAVTGYRSSYYAFGAVDPHQLIYGYNFKGQVIADLPMASEAERFGVEGRNGYHLYPGCEVITNRSLKDDPVCEVNEVPWAVGDLVEAPHNVVVNTVGHFTDLTQNSPSNGSLSSVDLVEFHGMGAVGNNFIAHRTVNLNDYKIFDRFGGMLGAPEMHRVEGYFSTGFSFGDAPGALIRIYGNPDHSNDPMTLFALPGGEITWNPATSTLRVPRIEARNLGGSSASASAALRGRSDVIGGSPLALGSCATGVVSIPGATRSMVPVSAAETNGAPGFSAQGGFQVSAQVTAPDRVTVSVCAVIAGTPRPSQYIVALE